MTAEQYFQKLLREAEHKDWQQKLKEQRTKDDFQKWLKEQTKFNRK